MPKLTFPQAAIEPLPEVRTRGFSIKSFAKPCVDFHWHFHPEWELTHIEKGHGVRQVARSVMPYADGDLCLIGANLPHAFGSHPENRTGARWTVLHFLPEVWGEAFWLLPENHRVRKMLAEARQGIWFSGTEIRICLDLLHRLEEASPHEVPLAIWMELMDRLARTKQRRLLNSAKNSEMPGRPIDQRLQKILTWIEENASLPEMTQASAARFLNMSPQAFSRFFHLHAGRSFQRYVNELRIARSCSTLLDPERTIGDIAFGSGFNNLSNFNRRFREILGCTPGYYRKSGGIAGR